MKRALLWIALTFCGLNALMFALMTLAGIAESKLDMTAVGAILTAGLAFATWKSHMALRQPAGPQSAGSSSGERPKKRGHDCFLHRDAILDIPADITADGNFDFEIVGESNYQHAIARILPPEAKAADKVRAYTIATIETEDDNEHDSKAVAVKIDRRVVGYLSRDDARRYRRWLSKNDAPDPATCRSAIVGTNKKGFGVWLDLPMENA